MLVKSVYPRTLYVVPHSILLYWHELQVGRIRVHPHLVRPAHLCLIPFYYTPRMCVYTKLKRPPPPTVQSSLNQCLLSINIYAEILECVRREDEKRGDRRERERGKGGREGETEIAEIARVRERQ